MSTQDEKERIGPGCYNEPVPMPTRNKEDIEAIRELILANIKLKKGITKAIDCAEQNVDDPDTVLIGILKCLLEEK